MPFEAQAAGGSYTIKWYGADPTVNHGLYLPTYTKMLPSSLACPGSAGRYADPLANAVAYSHSSSTNPDAVTSLMPAEMGLGQVVPFEMEIRVNGITTPENGVIQVTTGFGTNTSSGRNFGFDPTYMIYCAFVDTADAGTIDSGTPAKVDSYTYLLQSNNQIQGTFQISGLDNGDNVIVEIWVVLKSTIPTDVTGNVHTEVISAKTASNDAIKVGNQEVNLLQVGDFFKTDSDVSVTKTDLPDPVVQGQELAYNLVVTNNAATTVASGTVVTDTLSPSTSFVSASGASYTTSGNTVTFNVGILNPSESKTLTIVSAVSNTAPSGNDTTTNSEAGGISRPTSYDIYNKALVSTVSKDSTSANNIYYQPTNVLGANPYLALTKSASPTTYSAVGQTITYTYTVTNPGNVVINGPITVTDNKIGTVTISSSSLAAGASVSGTATYTVTQADINSGLVTNSATASGKFNSATVTSNTATAMVTATQTPTLTLTKSASPTTYNSVGQTITYTYTVTNSGNVDISGPITVTDNKIGTVTLPSSSLAPGATVSGTATYTITHANINSGSVINQATASGIFNSATVTSNTATATVTVATVIATQTPALSIVKTANPISYSAVGQKITYAYTVTNSGNVVINGPITVTDNKIDDAIPISDSSLDVGASVSGTATYTITSDDITAGLVTNTAYATGKFNSVPFNSATDDETIRYINYKYAYSSDSPKSNTEIQLTVTPSSSYGLSLLIIWKDEVGDILHSETIERNGDTYPGTSWTIPLNSTGTWSVEITEYSGSQKSGTIVGQSTDSFEVTDAVPEFPIGSSIFLFVVGGLYLKMRKKMAGFSNDKR
ncbi:beta strand repeat-containing protein [uncultured Methanomethylovorans sp.]|uniref:beta strand repeat-containing protein n=1 Tax=uncultured Methanomethylovorans sp. TaxID=183759 RepID=UPI00374A1A95